MNRLVLSLLAPAAVLLLAACDTTSAVAPYSPSTANVLAFQSALKTSGSKVAVGQVVSDGTITKPTCRMAGSLDVAPGSTVEEYIKSALQTELFTAQVYDVKSPVVINGRMDELKVNTFGTGSWALGMTVTSSVDPVGYHVQVVQNFSSSFSAVAACRNATNAFAPAVQQLLGQVVNNPGFSKLTSPS